MCNFMCTQRISIVTQEKELKKAEKAKKQLKYVSIYKGIGSPISAN